MLVQFTKYHGTGNDFIMIDGRSSDTSHLSKEVISGMCSRRLGIGADGLIILEESKEDDFYMRYFNADGGEGSMCGNGGRSIVAFARDLGIIKEETVFKGVDGRHVASILPDGNIRLKLNDVHGIEALEDGYRLDTGSPHFVKLVENLNTYPVDQAGSQIRHEERFAPCGINVNFLEKSNEDRLISVRTFERGVEAETLSCGTGVTASAICAGLMSDTDIFAYRIQTRGGLLKVEYKTGDNETFTDIWLSGPALHVYNGSFGL